MCEYESLVKCYLILYLFFVLVTGTKHKKYEIKIAIKVKKESVAEERGTYFNVANIFTFHLNFFTFTKYKNILIKVQKKTESFLSK